MKRYSLFCGLLLHSLVSFAQINVINATDGSMTVTPKGIRGKLPTDQSQDTENVVLGDGALKSNTKANRNVAIGRNALTTQSFSNSNTAYATDNVAIGNNALATNNPTSTANGSKNVAVGSSAMQFNTTGTNNTGVGFGALYLNTTGAQNTALGTTALNINTTGSNNVAVGYLTLRTNTTGSGNSAFGREALRANAIGNNNVAIGGDALFASTGDNNTAIGYQSGYISQGNRNVFIGYKAGYSYNTSDMLIIENTDSQKGIIVGNFATNKLGINYTLSEVDARDETLQVDGDAFKSTGSGNWIVPSDRRLKKNIEYLNSEAMLQKVMALKGVTYHWIDPKRGTDKMYGFIAQELQTVFPYNVKESKNGYLSASYGALDPMLVEAIKALEQRGTLLNEEQQVLKNQLETIEDQVASIQSQLTAALAEHTIHKQKISPRNQKK